MRRSHAARATHPLPMQTSPGWRCARAYLRSGEAGCQYVRGLEHIFSRAQFEKEEEKEKNGSLRKEKEKREKKRPRPSLRLGLGHPVGPTVRGRARAESESESASEPECGRRPRCVSSVYFEGHRGPAPPLGGANHGDRFIAQYIPNPDRRVFTAADELRLCAHGHRS